MNKYLLICASLTILLTINGQMIQYANRFKNLTIESENESVHSVAIKIYQDKREHKADVTVNVTKDINGKSIEVIVHRCSFEKSDCENFQRWMFIKNMKTIVYMKNQIWTPLFDHVTPKFDIPLVKKNIYRTSDASLDAKAIITWYPECVNYFWRADVIMRDQMDKKAFIMKLEFIVFTFVEGIKKKDRGGTRNRKQG